MEMTVAPPQALPLESQAVLHRATAFSAVRSNDGSTFNDREITGPWATLQELIRNLSLDEFRQKRE
jgi:hypothetical protein